MTCCYTHAIQLNMLMNTSMISSKFFYSFVHSCKVKSRARLNTKTLDVLSRLNLNAESYRSFDYNQAYQIWVDSAEKGRYNVGMPSTSKPATTHELDVGTAAVDELNFD